MSRNAHVSWLLVALAMLAAPSQLSCSRSSSGDDDANSPVPLDVAKLVPPDAFLFMHVPSVSALESKVRALASIADPRIGPMIELSGFFTRGYAIDPSFLDRDKPVGFALSLPSKKGPPLATAVVPVKNPDLVLTSVKGRTGSYKAVRLGSYIGFSEAPGYASGTSRQGLTSGVAPADATIRVDLKKLFAFYQPEIEKGLARAERDDPTTAQMVQLLDGLRSFVRSADSMDVLLNVAGKRVDVSFTYKRSQVSETSAAKSGDLATLASFLPADHPIVFLAAGNPAELIKTAGAWYENAKTPRPGRAAHPLAAYVQKLEEIQGLGGEATAASIKISKRGLEVLQIVRAKDAASLPAKMRSLASDPVFASAGLMSTDAKESTVAGVTVFEHRLKVDVAKLAASMGTSGASPEAVARAEQAMKELFGAGGFRLRYAAVGGYFVTMLGGDDALASDTLSAVKKGKGEIPTRLRSTFASDATSPTFLVDVELRSLAQDIVVLLGDATFFRKFGVRTPVVPKGAPVSFTVSSRSEGAVTKGGVSLDVGAAADMLRALKR